MTTDGVNAASAASPKTSSSLRTRLISALIAIPLLLGIVLLGYWPVVLLVCSATLLGLREFYGLLAHGGYYPRRMLGYAAGLALVLATAVAPLLPGFPLLPATLTLILLGSLLAELPNSGREGTLAAWGLTLGGALYVGWLLSHFMLLRGLGDAPLAPLGLPLGVGWMFVVFAITWLQDTFAYFAGRAFGRHKLAPLLSPKKTWEGAAGGMLGAIVGGVAAVLLFGLPTSPLVGALLGVVGGVVGPLGDLAESLFKRQVGLKDAGGLFPGHGGILDRADSLLFTAPVIYYLIVLIQ